MEIQIQLTKDEFKDIASYCELNKLNMNEIIRKSFLEGFRIEKYGLLNSKSEIKEVIKEVIKTIEVPVEIIKEIPKIEYIEIEKPIEKIIEIIKEVPTPPKEIEVIKYVDREVIKEVFVEKDVSNFDNIYDKKYIDELKEKITQLENKPPIIKEIILNKNDETSTNRINALQTTLQTLRQENIDKDKKLKECEKMVDEIKKFNNDMGAVYLNRSNLDDRLYK